MKNLIAFILALLIMVGLYFIIVLPLSTLLWVWLCLAGVVVFIVLFLFIKAFIS